MRGFFPLCHAISLLQALWHSRLYMTTAIGGGSLSLNKNGFPILVQHGTTASIKDIGLFNEPQKYAKVIYIARLGYGESSPYILDNMLEYGNLVEALSIMKFGILCSSVGHLMDMQLEKYVKINNPTASGRVCCSFEVLDSSPYPSLRPKLRGMDHRYESNNFVFIFLCIGIKNFIHHILIF
jgi:hypothetical protein